MLKLHSSTVPLARIRPYHHGHLSRSCLLSFVILFLIQQQQVPTRILNHHNDPTASLGTATTSFAQAQQVISPNLLQPYFTKSMDLLNVRENTPVDEIIYTLEAQTEPQNQPGVRVLYDIEGTQLFSLVDRASGQVRVAQPIDHEQTGDSLTFQVVATPYFQNRPGSSTKLTITVYVLDENDNAPRVERVIVGKQEYDSQALARQQQLFVASSGFNRQQLQQGGRVPVIRLNVSEDTQAESVIVDLIEAIDVDKASSNPLSATCLECEPEFKLVSKSASSLNDRLEWSIVLVRQLVHVPRNNVRPLNVIVSDGKFNSSLVFEITIDDVQNRPPHFISSTTCVVVENTPIDKTVLTIQAVDGDALAMEADGPIVPTKSSNSYSGRQIIYDFVEPPSGPGGSVRSSSVRDDFKLHPLTGQLQVANRLDREAYLSTMGVLSLQVRARELTVDAETVAMAADDLYESILSKLTNFIDPSEDSISVSEVTVIVVDVNDNSPRWLNASEIQLMNEAPVWYANLPGDRDTGRNYQVKVRENSPAGSPLTSKSLMFVYDLDAGDNAEFNITLDDPFNLFDVEPKRVSGFSSVTLKLAERPPTVVSEVAGPLGTNRRLSLPQAPARMLDYENINERSYIIQLYAIETKTKEQFRSKAQIQINVLDVNDNAPEFKELAYVANVREDAPAGKVVKLIQATDRDEISKQLTYSLHGQSAYLFDISAQSGLVTVAKCQEQQQAAPSRTRLAQQPRSCIDYETQRQHHLMVEASDGELSSKVPLTIFIEDASDNAPVFSLPIVDVVIEEGSERLEPPLKIEASDVDQTSTLTYSIVEGNFEGLFSINNVTGELQLTRVIRLPHDDDFASASSSSSVGMMQHPQQMNKMTLIVQASDGQHTTNGTIRIDILDANDNAPKFSRLSYEKEISETATAGQSVLTVRAFDMDRGNNARVSYRIERGSYGQFDINEVSGEISVASGAKPFDATKKDNYTIEVVAYDHGLISKSSSVLVFIRVLPTGKRAPEFEPQIQRETINENTLNNTIIHRMSVSEPLQQQQQQQGALAPTSGPAVLMFEPGPIEGLDKNGSPVTEVERLESMFSVSTNTGDVVVNSGLDHDFAAYVNLTIFVSYRPIASSSPSPMPFDSMSNQSEPMSPVEEYTPRSVGYLLINVMDDNQNAPIFAPPWTPQQPELSYQMLEELPVGSILTQLTASDVDSKISHFEIDPPSEYFELTSPQSGVIVNKKVIDYDTLMRQTFLSPGAHHRPGGSSAGSPSQQVAVQQQQQFGPNTNNIIQFNVLVYDSGLKQLSAKAIVSVEILPINDNDCKFDQQLYEVHVRENALPDTVVTQVRANDLDYGEQHNSLSYALLGNERDFFNIDPRKGVVTVSNRGSIQLDREQLASPVISLTVIGRDDQQQADPSVPRPMGGKRAQHQHQSSNMIAGRSCSTTLRIIVDDVNDNPPLFAQKLYEVSAYDTDSSDVPLVKLIVHDEDLKHSMNTSTGKQQQASSSNANSFRILSGNINESFNITPTGMIYVTKPLNESLSPRVIELRVQVKQQSSGASGLGQLSVPALFTDECLVRVNVMKLNRFAPEWRLESLKGARVEENAKPGTLVTQLKCADRDFEGSSSSSSKQSAPTGRYEAAAHKRPSSGASQQHAAVASSIRYWIKENGTNTLETSEFRLDSVSGNLITRIELDREKQDLYQLVVSCEDNGRPQSLESITPLYVVVLDVDDNRPEFVVAKGQQQHQQLSARSLARSASAGPSPLGISFLVEEHQSKGLQVGELKAIDRDLDSRFPITYCLLEGNEYQEFVLDQVTGILYTNQTLDREKQASYELLVRAYNDGRTCEEIQQAEVVNSLPSGSASTTVRPLSATSNQKSQANDLSAIRVRVDVQDINDNAPVFRRPTFKAGVHHRSLLGTLVTQVAAIDLDNGSNGTLNYRISKVLMYKTNPNYSPSSSSSHGGASSYNHHQHHSRDREQNVMSKPIELIQSPFKIDQQGNIYTQQLLTQYQLMSMFVLHLEATEMAEPWRTATTKLEVYVYETNSQLKIRINLHPRLVEAYRLEIESLLSNATKFSAIINRARTYQHQGSNQADSQLLLSKLKSHQSTSANKSPPTLDLSNQVPTQQQDQNEPNFSNIHAIFVDGYRLVNPNLVIEKFDLTSAQLLFTPQSLSQQLGGSDATGRQAQNNLANSDYYAGADSKDVTSLIDKIALASAVQSAEFHASPSSLAGIDWLESPSVLYVCLTSMLVLIGFIICLFGCCCTSRIKDHIIKVAMDKLVKQQTLQAKINERVLAATNQAYANSALGVIGNAGANTLQSAAAANGNDFILQQGGGFMSSFDATKGCLNNNYENMSILQRAMEAGEFIDPNYTTLNNGHLNLGAHYYDASELEGNTQQQDGNGDYNGKQQQQTTGSVVSLSLGDEEDEQEMMMMMTDNNNPEMAVVAANGDLDGGQQQQLAKKSRLYSNGVNGLVSSNSRMRQQIPNNNNNNNNNNNINGNKKGES